MGEEGPLILGNAAAFVGWLCEILKLIGAEKGGEKQENRSEGGGGKSQGRPSPHMKAKKEYRRIFFQRRKIKLLLDLTSAPRQGNDGLFSNLL